MSISISAHRSSAGFQPAVSPISNRQASYLREGHGFRRTVRRLEARTTKTENAHAELVGPSF